MLVLQTTINTSKRFLDYTNYEYALAHKKILETYNNSAKVNQEYNYILMKSKDDSEDVKINFRGDRVYIDKFKDSNSFSGYILLSQEHDTIYINIIDKNDNNREMILKVKDEKTNKEKEKEEKEKKEKEEKEKKEKLEKQNNNGNKTGELVSNKEGVQSMSYKFNHKRANAIIASILVTILVIAVMFSIVGIYINKMYTMRSLNDYYDTKITQQLQENNKSK